ncbi:MAG: class I SAM-dependent methyltransferase [Acidobacteria bacterium]|nr:class I SAM-dependent methyltransferase [Acidobacteriota bacterium]
MEPRPCVVCSTPQRPKFTCRGHQYFRCPRCGLVSTYPYPDAAAIEAHYAARYREGNYQTLRDNAGCYRAVYQGLARIYLSDAARLGLNFEGARLLDIGCFTGGFLEVMAAHGLDVYGEELQPEAVAEANRKFPGRVFPAAGAGDHFPAMHFEAVSMNAVIEHVVDPVKLLSRAAGLLAPGGFLMLETPDCSSFFARLLGRFWMPYAPVEHIHLFSRRSLAQALRRAGFEGLRFHRHWKLLPLGYAFDILRAFRPELRGPIHLARRALAPALRLALPFYIGEMVVTARKAKCPN